MKRIGSIVLGTIFLFSVVPTASAQLVLINKDGEIIVKVLAEESVNLEAPQRQLEIKDVAEGNADSSQIFLKKENNKISMSVSSGQENKELDVTEWTSTLVEVEERPEIQKIKIGLDNGKFTILQRGITAITDFPLTVDSESAKISVTTTSGDRYISILPYEAVESALRAKVLNVVPFSEKVQLTEEEQELMYVIEGDKQLNFFKMYTHSFPVESKISALDGSILSTNEPIWLRLLGYIFG